MVGVHVDGIIIVYGELGMFDAFFGQLKQQRFSVRNLGKYRCTLVARLSLDETTESSR